MTTSQHGFELLQDRMIPELNSRARLYRHAKTGAELLSLENDDENKVFGINFGTPPADSTGLPHIMEHAVLGGSRKYPVKEPFVELLKGSLKTFVNAMTYSDKTCYPVASQNVQDFYNLIDVYLDAVFYPNLTPFTLKQEGWHYELEGTDAPLTYKGVVFNEMKGAYSDPDNLMARCVEQVVFPDTIYAVDSGGDPAVIPDLTYEQFKAFHDTYYHPSNAYIFFYGDDDADERLRYMNEWLEDFERKAVDTTVALQPAFAAPRREVVPFAISRDEDASRKGMMAVNWMLSDVTDLETVFGLSILSHILIGTPASPLRKALIDSGLGEDLAGIGFEADLRQTVFSTGLKGIAVEDTDTIERLILDTLQGLASGGIDAAMVEASVNTIEFQLRENNTGSYPRGLWLMIKALRTWLHGGDPLAQLAFEAPLQAIKERVAAGESVFEGLIRQYLLDNPHRVTLIMQPDPDKAERVEAAEKARLAGERAAMSDADLQRIMDEAQTLQRMQATPDTPEALATIPSLTLSDLDPQVKTVPIEVDELAGCRVLYHDLFTNGIVYLDLGFDLHALPAEDVPYMGLFGRALLELGTETEDFVTLSQRIGRKTGGIEPANLAVMTRDADKAVVWSFLRGKATVAQSGELLNILRDVLLTARLDNKERFRQLVLEEKADHESSLLPAGHMVIYNRLKSYFNEADWANEQMGGVANLLFLRRLVEDIDREWPAVLARLEAIRDRLLNRRAMLVNVTVDAASWQAIRPELVAFLDQLPSRVVDLGAWNPPLAPVNEGMTVPAQVNYVGKAANLYALGYELHGSSAVITNYLRTTWLWERVRVHGGAYGGFCAFDHRSGMFAYLSYRDPNLLATIKSYDGTGEFLRKLQISQDELVKGIIGAIGAMDAYQLPDAKGYSSMIRHLTGDTDTLRQQFRDEILGTSAAHFTAFADVLDRMTDVATVTVLGAEDAIHAANADNGAWLSVVKVL